MGRRSRVSGALVVLVALSAGKARAQEPSADDRALATELFREGRALLAQGRTAEACAKLEESQRLDPGGGTLLNVAACHEQLGRTATAWGELVEALGVARRDHRSDRVAVAEKRIAALEPKLSRLVVTVSAATDGTDVAVLRDGSPLARAAWGVAAPVDPGQHRIEASAPGREPWSIAVEVGPDGDRREVVVPPLRPVEPAPASATAAPLAPAAPAAPPGPEASPPAAPVPLPLPPAPLLPPARQAGGRATAAWIVGAAGVAAVAVGATAGIVAVVERAKSDDAASAICKATGQGCSTDAVGLNDRAKAWADVSTVAFGAGVAAVGVAVYLIVTAPRAGTSAARVDALQDCLAGRVRF